MAVSHANVDKIDAGMEIHTAYGGLSVARSRKQKAMNLLIRSQVWCQVMFAVVPQAGRRVTLDRCCRVNGAEYIIARAQYKIAHGLWCVARPPPPPTAHI